MFKYNYQVDLNSNTSAAQIIKLVRKGSKVLEVGCATGYMSQVLKYEWGCKVVGIEINEEAAAIASQYCDKIYTGNIEELVLHEMFQEGEFDTIILADVLEHLLNPGKVLENCKKVLRKDGVIIASIPNIAHASIILNLVSGKFTYNTIGLLDETHLRFYTKATIYDLFENNGYIITHLSRTRIKPENTEFVTDLNRYEEALIKELYNSNPEAETYQFILEAVPSTDESKIRQLNTRIKNLELEKLVLEKAKIDAECSLKIQKDYSDSLEGIIANKDADYMKLEEHVRSIEDSMESSINLNARVNLDKISELETRVQSLQMEIEGLNKQVKEYNDEINRLLNVNEHLLLEKDQLNAIIKDNNLQIQSHQHDLQIARIVKNSLLLKTYYKLKRK